MKTVFPFIISMMFICFTALPQKTNTYSADLTNLEGIKKNVLFHSPSLEDNLLNDAPDRVLSIYLPSGYDENTDLRYPVVYMLHGFTQDQNIWYGSGSVMPLDVKSILDSLISRNAIAPMIIVSANARNAYYGSFYTNSYVTGDWEDFIVNDLVAYIDSNYRTLAVCESRGIGGHSMGGYGTIKLAMKHPDIFGAAYALSGACLVFEDVILGTMKQWLIQAAGSSSLIGLPWQALTMVAQAAAYSPDSTALPFYGQFPVTAEGVVIDSIWQKWLLNDPYTMIPIYRDSLLKLKALQFDCGTSDYLLYNANVHFSQTLTENGIEHHFEPYDGDHTNGVEVRIETKLLPFFSENLVHPFTGVQVSSFDAASELRIYPNPANDLLTIETESPGNCSIEITSMNGQIVYKGEMDGSTMQIDIAQFSRGVFFVTLRSKEFMRTEKVVKL